MTAKELQNQIENSSYEEKVKYAAKAYGKLSEYFLDHGSTKENLSNFFRAVSNLILVGDYACNKPTCDFYNEVFGDTLWPGLAIGFCGAYMFSPARENLAQSFMSNSFINEQVTILVIAALSCDGKINFNEQELINDLVNRSIRPIKEYEGEEKVAFDRLIEEYNKEFLLFGFDGLDLSVPQNITYKLKQRLKQKASEMHQRIIDEFHSDAMRVVERQFFSVPFSELINKYLEYSKK